MAYKIFISYPAWQNWPANTIKNQLIDCGAEVFLDTLSIEFGENFEDIILKNLQDCNELWVLVTPTVQVLTSDYQPSKNIKPGSMTRPYILLEIGVAWCKRIPIIPVLIDMSLSSFNEDKDIPQLLRGKEAVVLSDQQQQNRLFQGIREKVEKAKKYQERSERHKTKLPISINFLNLALVKEGFLLQISENGKGCFISSNHTSNTDDNIQIQFTLEGQIRHNHLLDDSDENGIGIKIQ